MRRKINQLLRLDTIFNICLIKQELKNNNDVKIYIFKSDDMLKYGEFDINLAAGLEDSLISTIKPIWNKK